MRQCCLPAVIFNFNPITIRFSSRKMRRINQTLSIRIHSTWHDVKWKDFQGSERAAGKTFHSHCRAWVTLVHQLSGLIGCNQTNCFWRFADGVWGKVVEAERCTSGSSLKMESRCKAHILNAYHKCSELRGKETATSEYSLKGRLYLDLLILFFIYLQ